MQPKPKPEKCHICGFTEFWLREAKWGPAEWLCCRCHPKPGENREKEIK